MLEWDEGNLRFNFIGKVAGRFVSGTYVLMAAAGPSLAGMLREGGGGASDI